jgi:2-phosphosulfolactate phosphatase
LPELLHECAGGRELTAYGFAEDVAVAAELDASRSVPVLRGDAFRAVP